jgi:inward rectifier potassium channel
VGGVADGLEVREAYRPGPEDRDLGFGSVLAQKQGLRLLNHDGSFNVDRRERHWWHHAFSYHGLVRIPWPKFFVLVLVCYFGLNALFAGLFLLCGRNALQGAADMSPFLRAFFFSVHTYATIGYGNIVPVGVAANMLVTVESLVGLLSFALATGLLFARFSRPHMDIVYSKHAVVAPYRGISGWMFRVVNERESQLIEVSAQVSMARFEKVDGTRMRKFYPLSLERQRVAFFPMSWTIVHPVNDESPLYGWKREDLIAAQTEFLVLLTAIDETFSQTVHSRTSYTAEEVVWNARFVPIFREDGGQRPTLDWERFHAVERVSGASTQG